MLPLVLSSLTLLSPAITAATSDRPRSVSTRGEGYLRHPIRTVPGAPKLRRRQETEATNPHNRGATYTVDIDIGTPPQTITVILDTGSNDLWVNPSCATANLPEYCAGFAQFDWTASSSFQDLKKGNIITYGKGNVTYEWVSDSVTIGGGTISAQIFGVGIESYDIPLGILGLSPSLRGPKDKNNYGFLLDRMATEGLIKSRAFSLDLRSIEEPEGAVIFGGIDTGKFVGKLEKIPMLNPSETPLGADRYYIYLNGVGATLPDGTAVASEPFSLPVFLDSGGTYSQLPTEIFLAIGEAVPGAQYDQKSNMFIVDCKIGDQPGSINFAFNNKVISVPWKDFVFDIDTKGLCVVGVLELEGEDGEPVFGDTFLRAAYVVYDQDNRNLHLAQAANCGTNVVAIGSGSGAVPSVTGDCTAAEAANATVNLDVTKTRVPTNVITNGPKVSNVEFGPGPAGNGQSTTLGGLSKPTPTDGPSAGTGDKKNGATSASVGIDAMVALGVANLVAFVL